MGEHNTGGPNGAINVTPLIDVCLVLLIIFMVMIPKDVPEISVRTPPERHGDRPPHSEPLVLGLSEDGAATLNRHPVGDLDELADSIASHLMSREKKVVYIDFDDGANYGEAVAVLDVAKRSGADVLALMHKRNDLIPDTLLGL